MFLCIFGNFPINRRKTIRNQKCVDLRKRAAAEKTAVRAQRARVRALQHQPRIRAFFHQRRLLLRLRAPENECNRLRKLCQCGNHRVGEALPAEILVGVCRPAAPSLSNLRFLPPERRDQLPVPYRYSAATAAVLHPGSQKKPARLPAPAHDTGPARESLPSHLLTESDEMR